LGVNPVSLSVIGERLGCSEERATLLLDGICGVRIDRRSGVARLVDPELAAAVRDAFAGQHGELRRLRRMGAMPVVPRAS
jgi:hypothetical protein